MPRHMCKHTHTHAHTNKREERIETEERKTETERGDFKGFSKKVTFEVRVGNKVNQNESDKNVL